MTEDIQQFIDEVYREYSAARESGQQRHTNFADAVFHRIWEGVEPTEESLRRFLRQEFLKKAALFRAHLAASATPESFEISDQMYREAITKLRKRKAKK